MNKKKYLIIIVCIGILSYFWSGLKGEQPAEDSEVVSGFGVDLEKTGKEMLYIAPSSVYTFEEGERVSSSIRLGEGITPARTRENRQIISNKRYLLGLEKAYIFSDSMVSLGIRNPIEIFFRNYNTNDNGYAVVCNGKPEEILRFKVPGYPSSADYIEGMLKNAKYYGFFSSKYKISDIFLNLASEGRNINLANIDIINNQLKITGLCIFKSDKMIAKLNMEDSKILNMLSDTDGKGIVSYRETPTEYVEYYGKVKRHVSVKKIGNSYKYDIDLKFIGDIVSDTIYANLANNAYVNNEIQTKLEKDIEHSCNSLIKKLKEQYKVDALQLGQYAAAKYGREKEIDWDDVFSKADIKVNVKVKIDRTGRGNYLLKEKREK